MLRYSVEYVMNKFAVAGIIVALLGVPALAQESPKPGPEHDVLKKLVGNWDTTMKMGGMDSKGTVTYKMELGGLWLTSSMESELLGQKFTGRGLDSYDAGKKKYVGVWADAMMTFLAPGEGTWDPATQTMTFLYEATIGEKHIKWRQTTQSVDADTRVFMSFVPDTADKPMMKVTYRRTSS